MSTAIPDLDCANKCLEEGELEQNQREFGKENQIDNVPLRRVGHSRKDSERRNYRDERDRLFLIKRLRVDEISGGEGSSTNMNIENDIQQTTEGQPRVVTLRKGRSREEVLAEQGEDEVVRERNKRMFGALLGTLERFKQEEKKIPLSPAPADVLQKAQNKEIMEEAAKKERAEARRRRREEILRTSNLLVTVKFTEEKEIEKQRKEKASVQVEEKTKELNCRFIRTKTKPHIFYMPKTHNQIRTETKPHIYYLPKRLNSTLKRRLEKSKQNVEEELKENRKRNREEAMVILQDESTRRVDIVGNNGEVEDTIMKSLSDDLLLTEKEAGHEETTNMDADAEPDSEIENIQITVYTSDDHEPLSVQGQDVDQETAESPVPEQLIIRLQNDGSEEETPMEVQENKEEHIEEEDAMEKIVDINSGSETVGISAETTMVAENHDGDMLPLGEEMEEG